MLSRSLSIVLFTLAASAVLSAGSGVDPLVSSWSGSWAFADVEHIDGAFDESTSGEGISELELDFTADHQATANHYDGKWKRHGGGYVVNLNDDATAKLASMASDANAEGKFTLKRVHRFPGDVLGGRVRASQRFLQNGQRFEGVQKGPFGCVRAPVQ